MTGGGQCKKCGAVWSLDDFERHDYVENGTVLARVWVCRGCLAKKQLSVSTEIIPSMEWFRDERLERAIAVIEAMLPDEPEESE